MMQMKLWDFKLEYDEPSLDHLGEVELQYDDWSECGSWTWWTLSTWIADDWHIGDEPWLGSCNHQCKDGDTEGCLLDEFSIDTESVQQVMTPKFGSVV